MANNKTSIGGQALIEGIMMKGPHKIATAVRRPDNEIQLKLQDIKPIFKGKLVKTPLVRGSIVLIDAMIVGIKELMYSAEFYEDEYEEDKLDKFLKKIFKDNAEKAIIYTSLIIALVVSVGVFIVGPTLLTDLLKTKVQNTILLNLIEGIVRVSLFLAYVLLISKMDDVYRVFQYHGAEHKSIYCYEHGEELIPENARKYSTLHPRCGTSFIVNVLIISIIVFSFFGWQSALMRVITRIVMLPVIAGISYEINRYIGRSENKLTKILSYPGFLVQKITTKEPDDSMLEVALTALKAVIPENSDDDKW